MANGSRASQTSDRPTVAGLRRGMRIAAIDHFASTSNAEPPRLLGAVLKLEWRGAVSGASAVPNCRVLAPHLDFAHRAWTAIHLH